MRTSYLSLASPTPFSWERMHTSFQRPTKVVVHRQGNPGVDGVNGIQWMARTGAASIHWYLDDARAYYGIPENRHAFHVLESREAWKFGLPSSGSYGNRGDYNTIGIECEDESPTSDDLAPGQTYGISQETRITLVYLLSDILQRNNLGVMDIIRHQDLDQWTRPTDPGDAINISDLRKDVQDVINGKTPWRVVDKYATGDPKPEPVMDNLSPVFNPDNPNFWQAMFDAVYGGALGSHDRLPEEKLGYGTYRFTLRKDAIS